MARMEKSKAPRNGDCYILFPPSTEHHKIDCKNICKTSNGPMDCRDLPRTLSSDPSDVNVKPSPLDSGAGVRNPAAVNPYNPFTSLNPMPGFDADL